MDAVLQNYISKVAYLAKRELELQQLRNEVNTLYNGSPNWDDAITQEGIDSVPSFAAAGLTEAMVANVIYSSSQAQGQIDGNLSSYFVMANLP